MREKEFNVIVIGAGYGGAVAAGRLAAQKRNNVRVTVVDRASGLAERIRLHQFVSGQPVPAIPYASLFEGTGVAFRQASVLRVDPGARQVVIDAGSGPEPLRYDRLVLANGSGDSRARVPGATRFTRAIATPATAEELRRDFDRLAAGSDVAVAGGGATAIETVTELADARRDLRFTLVTAGRVGEALSEGGRRHVLRALAARSVRVVEGERITEVRESELALSASDPIRFDLAIWAAAFTPSPLARESGFAVSPDEQLLVDATLRSVSHPDVYGVGDTALVETLEGNVAIRMACATALPMGAHVADNLDREARGETPERFAFGYQVQCVSLGRRDGVLQFVRHDDTPRRAIVTGLLGAAAKELICRYTIRAVRSELRGERAVRWSKPRPLAGRPKELLQEC